MEASKVTVDDAADARPRLDLAVWAVPLASTLAALAVLVALFFGTFRSIVAIWSRSDTFAHGYLILPICAYLIWDERERLFGLAPKPTFSALPVMAVLGVGWLFCRVAGVLVLEQYFAVAMIPVVVWAVLGTAVTRELAFPLGFLLLGVPVGEFLIPPLIDFTAAFTAAGLRLSGVPVLKEGNFLTLSNSRWSVVEACSGLRYLIACSTLGVLYAYLTYRSWWRRALCLVAAIIVPIIANGMRAYMIVLLGHVSDMRIAVGIDHLIYGWLFFGVVILLFFWVGSFFREDNVDKPGPELAPRTGAPSSTRSFLVAACAVVFTATLWPAWAGVVEAREVELRTEELALPRSVEGGWVRTQAGTNWRPHYVGADRVAVETYENGGAWVGAHAACYGAQTQGAELVNSSNVLVRDDSEWRQIESRQREVDLEIGAHHAMEGKLASHEPTLLAWKWYWIDGTGTVSPYRAKLVELTGKLAGRPPLACGVTVFTPDTNDASARLTRFLNDALPTIDRSLMSLRKD